MWVTIINTFSLYANLYYFTHNEAIVARSLLRLTESYPFIFIKWGHSEDVHIYLCTKNNKWTQDFMKGTQFAMQWLTGKSQVSEFGSGSPFSVGFPSTIEFWVCWWPENSVENWTNDCFRCVFNSTSFCFQPGLYVWGADVQMRTWFPTYRRFYLCVYYILFACYREVMKKTITL